MSEEKRLHPISTVINFVKQLKEAVIPLVVLLFLNRRGQETFFDYLPLIGMGIFLLVILVSGILKWWRFTYRLEEGELRIEYGLFVKKKRYIPFERIQSLNYSEGIFHRPLKLVKIKVETAGSSSSLESEAELTAITKEEANYLNSVIAKAKKRIKETNEVLLEEGTERADGFQAEVEPEEKVLYKMTIKDLIIMATTSGGAGVVISGVLIFLSQFNELIPFEAVMNEFVEVIQSGLLLVAIAVFLVLLVAWFIAVILTFIRYAEFTVKLIDNDLVITRGLLEKKQTTIPLNRIQGIRFNQNILREPFNYTSVTIESAGGSVLEKDSNTIRLLPMIRAVEAVPILKQVLPDYQWETDFIGAPKRSIFRYMFWNLLFITIAIVPVSYFFFPAGLFSLLLYPLVIGLSWLQYKSAGYCLSEDQLTVRFRVFDKQTVYMKKKRIQSLELRETIFQRRGKVATLSAVIKSYSTGSVNSVSHLDVEDVEKVMEWYEPEGQRSQRESSQTHNELNLE
ncbi:PH domain-containing protein [Jeotgalibacillus proteolyticus]|uniref:YdbS-like PH domain-containing protein n=1 Tax=Jeotgalibacillus proteolyticus TaxID=2082395 RepID=A0A2S5GBZ6_9BACL|nr:PH domain-containing protein [Jeotgalibacillus proteolyticus]PPA70552.1 hypothetical protein C4B60_07035 [Jeotgalibacillus proteolyticus]